MREDVTTSNAGQTTDGSAPVGWKKPVGRRAFLAGAGLAGAAVIPGGALLASNASADVDPNFIPPGDFAVLRFLAAAELIETDLWVQYNELGGVNGGNPSYMAALANIDSDMNQYITLNTEDEQSHADFLNAYIKSKGGQPVDLDPFRTLASSKASGAVQGTGRLTNLMALDVDTSFYTRYRSSTSPDFGATFPQAITIKNQPAIPISDSDTPPGNPAPLPPASPAEARMQVIACTAAFHFAFIEGGGSSLYATLTNKVTNGEVLRVVASIGGTEDMHFATWQDDAGNAASDPIAPVTDPVTGLTIPDLNVTPGGPLFQTNLIFPHPCEFISPKLPLCAIVRPTDPRFADAAAAVKALTDDGLFTGQSKQFFNTLNVLAAEADAAVRL